VVAQVDGGAMFAADPKKPIGGNVSLIDSVHKFNCR
jgi:hypothetical protein